MNPVNNISPSTNENIDFQKLVLIIKTNWYWIALIFISINITSYLYIRYSKNLYESESELKLDIKSKATELGIKTMVQDDNLNVVSGEIEIIQSKLFLSRVAQLPDFKIGFYSLGRVLDEELFKRPPAFVNVINERHSYYDIPIKFEEIDMTEFILRVNDQEYQGRYGSKLKVGDLELLLTRNHYHEPGDEVGYLFIIHSEESLLSYFLSNLTAEPLNFNANTIRVSFKDHNAFKAQAVLNKIDTLYLEYSNEQKNLVNKQKIDWLINELSQIERKMEDYEDYFENFTIENRSSNLEADLQLTIQAIQKIDSQRYHYSKRIDDLSTLVKNIEEKEFDLALNYRQALPQDIREQVNALENLHRDMNRLQLSYREVTLAYRQKQNEVQKLETSLLRDLKILKASAEERLIELNKQKAILETQFAEIPDKNTEFTKNQRFYKLYEEFYLSLMQSKSQFEIAQAGTTPDFKILSSASFPAAPISPKRFMIIGAGFVASMVMIFFFIGIAYLTNNKVMNLYELEEIENAPLLGSIPLARSSDDSLYIKEHPRSRVSEAIRSLRTNLDFFQLSGNKKVVAISSTVSGEGKSFIAKNLGGVIAFSHKRVVLVDLDMRKPKTAQPASYDPSKGVSTILIRKNNWKECIVATEVEGFDFIPSGPHPPNPSELLLNGEFNELLDQLKSNYDFIILDTPPVGIVTDGIMALKKADLSIYVFRANYSNKNFIKNLTRLVNVNKITSVTTVLNAVHSLGKTYGYGYYEESDKPKGFKSFLRR